ncbi:MAG: hypothetical protein R3B40_03825 [Polyangiales bacterium]
MPAPTVADPAVASPRMEAAAFRRLAVLASGTAFALAAALPGALTAGVRPPHALGLLAPLLLVALLWTPATRSALGLLVLYPLTVGASAAWSQGATPSALAAVMIAGTWAAYATLALRHLRPASTWTVAHHAIVDALPAPPPRQRITRIAYWSVLLAGGLMLALVAPMLGSDARYRATWGDAALGARLLVAVVGGATAVGSVGAIAAKGLRQRPADPTQTLTRTRRRALLYLVAAAAFGGVAWAIGLRK